MKKELFSHSASVFPVADVGVSAKWYEDKLGFTIGFLWQDPPSYGVLHRGDKVSLHLSETEMENVSPKAILYIFVYDVDELYAEFLERQTPVLGPPQDTDYQMREFELCDPDGNRLVFGKSLAN
ncbi:MAG: VOC family protein [Bacteroidota bacterium]